MCRSIKTLRGDEPTTGDVAAPARQYVRKLSGFRTPSRANTPAYDAAVAEIAEATQRLLLALGTEPHDGPERLPVKRAVSR
jgi:hypothetical protein